MFESGSLMELTAMVYVLPTEVAQGATLRGNEYGWSLSSFPAALARAEASGYACLGGRRSCSEVLNRFQHLASTTDFGKEALSWPSIQIDTTQDLVFVAYFVTETDLASTNG